MKKLDLEWLKNISKEENIFVLREYRYLVHRFAQWMGLTISKTENEKVRQLILPNFIEESGTLDGNKSHLKMLDSLLESLGIQSGEFYNPTEKTKEIENSFYATFDGINSYRSLCVLGPSTEGISEQFLSPLQEVTIRYFPFCDAEYFDVHLSVLEDEHAIAIDKAILDLEKLDSSLVQEKESNISFGFNLHKSFWDSLILQINSRQDKVLENYAIEY